MVLIIDTAAENTFMGLWDSDWLAKNEFKGGRELNAKIITELKNVCQCFDKLTGIIVNAGPGSFTGLRIGLSVANTIAYSQNIPIVGVESPENIEDLLQKGQKMLKSAGSEFSESIIPFYGAEPHITQPKG